MYNGNDNLYDDILSDIFFVYILESLYVNLLPTVNKKNKKKQKKTKKHANDLIPVLIISGYNDSNVSDGFIIR